jgi:hypothetical protein
MTRFLGVKEAEHVLVYDANLPQILLEVSSIFALNF